jgi:hypothetical protein
MKQFKELMEASARLFLALGGKMIWLMAIVLFTVVLVLIPIFAAAGIYWIICAVRHTSFEWVYPIAAGLCFDILVTCTVLDEDLL